MREPCALTADLPRRETVDQSTRNDGSDRRNPRGFDYILTLRVRSSSRTRTRRSVCSRPTSRSMAVSTSSSRSSSATTSASSALRRTASVASESRASVASAARIAPSIRSPRPCPVGNSLCRRSRRGNHNGFAARCQRGREKRNYIDVTEIGPGQERRRPEWMFRVACQGHELLRKLGVPEHAKTAHGSSLPVAVVARRVYVEQLLRGTGSGDASNGFERRFEIEPARTGALARRGSRRRNRDDQGRPQSAACGRGSAPPACAHARLRQLLGYRSSSRVRPPAGAVGHGGDRACRRERGPAQAPPPISTLGRRSPSSAVVIPSSSSVRCRGQGSVNLGQYLPERFDFGLTAEAKGVLAAHAFKQEIHTTRRCDPGP